MVNRDRSLRRFKAELKKKRVSRYGVAGYWWNDCVAVTDKRIIGKVATTPKACGCWMCANHSDVFGESFVNVRRRLQNTGGE